MGRVADAGGIQFRMLTAAKVRPSEDPERKQTGSFMPWRCRRPSARPPI
jgi:hypothetical protein